MSKVERLLNLTAALLDTQRPLSAKELRDKVEGYASGDDDSFLRMFERDKGDLRAMGVPIEVETSFSGADAVEGYRIASKDYHLPDLNLTESELEAINLAVLSTKIDTDDVAEGIWKIGGATPVSSRNEVLGNISFDESLPTLFAAIRDNNSVRFSYGDQDRIVSPWKLDFKRAKWYLIGFDHTRGAERNFRLDRFTSAISIDDTVEWFRTDSEAHDRRPWEYGDSPELVQLWVDQDRVTSTASLLGERAALSHNGDGSALFEVPVSSIEPFFAMVIDLLDAAEIKGPPAIRAKFVEQIERVGELHGTKTSA